MRESREDIRNSVLFTVELSDQALGTLTFRARDLSKSGVFLERIEPSTPLPAVGSKVHLTIKWPLETEVPPVKVEATIIRQSDDGVGARFVLPLGTA